MRKNLQAARQKAGLTQQAMADKLGVGLRQYQRIEAGTSYGTFEMWDALEDMFNIHQRKLRENATTHLDPKASQSIHHKD